LDQAVVSNSQESWDIWEVGIWATGGAHVPEKTTDILLSMPSNLTEPCTMHWKPQKPKGIPPIQKLRSNICLTTKYSE
jgi:hypothetical protein